MKRLLFILVAMVCVAVGMTSCKAWRTISTTATYTKTSPQTLSQGEGDGKEVVTITTKTVEEYQGTRKK
ncbi:MAG: hypothetical protein IJQ20_10310 [Paludibacteraceae bacterium]|nr:hypothetical protein [Paludibacteraceae bacterium]